MLLVVYLVKYSDEFLKFCYLKKLSIAYEKSMRWRKENEKNFEFSKRHKISMRKEKYAR